MLQRPVPVYRCDTKEQAEALAKIDAINARIEAAERRHEEHMTVLRDQLFPLYEAAGITLWA